MALIEPVSAEITKLRGPGTPGNGDRRLGLDALRAAGPSAPNLPLLRRLWPKMRVGRHTSHTRPELRVHHQAVALRANAEQVLGDRGGVPRGRSALIEPAGR